MRELVMAADIGASKILTGIVSSTGQVLAREKLPTPSPANPEKVVDLLAASLECLGKRLIGEKDLIMGCAVAAPGPISYPEIVVLDSPNLAWSRVSLKSLLEGRMNRPVIVEKDTNMAVRGEYRFARPGCSNLVYITVSSGIGGGMILNGRLFRGSTGGAGEIGHMIVEPAGRMCKCGRRGCLEAQASGLAVELEAGEMNAAGWNPPRVAGQARIGAREIGEAARLGDLKAMHLVEKVSVYLGEAIANIANMINPEMVVLGGSVALGWQDLLEKHLQAAVARKAFALNTGQLKIEFTGLGEDIVLLGCVAACLADT